MNKIRLVVLVCLIILVFVGCSTMSQTVKFEDYKGDELNIGIIGKKPNVLHDKVIFNTLDFKDLEERQLKGVFDAIFITKENLLTASKSKYTLIYKTANIPFFFIESKKGCVPFVQEDLEYNDVPILDDLSYISGVYYNENNYNCWGYCLYNDIENEENITNVYNRIFKTISEITE